MRILSLANSSSFMVTMSLPSTAAFRAAWLTRFSRSAPEKPTVPRAMILASIAEDGEDSNCLIRLQIKTNNQAVPDKDSICNNID